MPAKPRDKPPLIEVEVKRGRLIGASAYDAELIEQISDGKLFRLEPARKRSLPQLRGYWKGLGILCEAKGWPGTVEQFHSELKRSLGYTIEAFDPLTGEVRQIVDSIALDSMTQDEFNVFFQRARDALAESLGFDAWRFLDEAKPQWGRPF